MEYLKSMVANRDAVTADTVITYDLPVNPVSHIAVDIEAALAVAYTPATIANFGAIFDKVEILFKGSSIISLTGMDLLAYSALITGKPAFPINRNSAVLSEQTMRFLIPFGRGLYNPLECFPAVRRGEFTLKLDYAASFTNIGSLDATITAVELPGATPAGFLKCTSISKTPIVGDNDVDLPIGNPIIGIEVFSTTVPTTTAKTTTVDKTKLLVDNVEHYLHDVRWPELREEFKRRANLADSRVDHTHRSDLAAAYTQFQATDEMNFTENWGREYGYIDFDPLNDGSFALLTEGKSRVWLKINAGDTNVLRINPIELIKVAPGA